MQLTFQNPLQDQRTRVQTPCHVTCPSSPARFTGAPAHLIISQ